jgi:hypothetical protein
MGGVFYADFGTNLAYRKIGTFEQDFCGVDTNLYQVVYRGKSGVFFELTGKIRFAHGEASGKLLKNDSCLVILLKIIYYIVNFLRRNIVGALAFSFFIQQIGKDAVNNA